MAEMLGKPVEALTLEDLTRGNLPRLTADLAALDAAGKRRLHDHLDAVLAEAEAESRHADRDLALVRLQVDMFKRGKEQGLLDALRAVGQAVPTMAAPQEAPAAAHPKPAPHDDPRRGHTLEALADSYFADRDLSASAQESNLNAFRDFHAVVGPKGISAVTAADVAAYKAWLLGRPGVGGRENSAVATVTKKLNHVRAALAWAADEAGILSETPGAKVKPPREGKRSKGQPKRLPFSPEVLTTILRSPLYTGAQGPMRLTVPGPYRAPAARKYFLLCMLLTGARTEELPGAELHDLDGITCLDLRETGTKSAAGARLVPVLPELRRTGFTAWARERLGAGEVLFRGRDCPADWSQWTGRYLAGIGVTDLLHTPYSLRHSFRVMLRAGNLNTETANRVFGHEEGTTGEEYGRGLLTVGEARAFLRCVRSPVDLGHLYTAR